MNLTHLGRRGSQSPKGAPRPQGIGPSDRKPGLKWLRGAGNVRSFSTGSPEVGGISGLVDLAGPPGHCEPRFLLSFCSDICRLVSSRVADVVPGVRNQLFPGARKPFPEKT